MATATQSQPMEWTDFEKTREHLALSEKQRLWVKTLIETNDPERSTATAYNSANSSYAKMLTHQVENNSRVIAALNRFHGLSDREAFVRQVERAIEQSDGWAKIRALSLLASLKFGTENSKSTGGDSEPLSLDCGTFGDENTGSEMKSSAEQFAVGDLVRQAGHTGRVLEVDANGRATRIEEVL